MANTTADLARKPKQSEVPVLHGDSNISSETEKATSGRQSLISEYASKNTIDSINAKDKTVKPAEIKQQGGKTRYEASDLIVVAENGVHTLQNKINGQINETLHFDSNRQKATLLDKKNRLLIELDGVEQFAKYSLTDKRALFQLAGKNINEASQLDKKLQEQSKADGSKLPPERIYVDADGRMAIFSKDANGEDTSIFIHKTDTGAVVEVNGNKLKVGKFSVWDHGAPPQLIGQDGKPTPVTLKEGKLEIGETSVNVFSGEIITNSDRGKVSITSSGGKSVVERKDIIKVSADKFGIIENQNPSSSLFRKFNTNQGIFDGSTSQAWHFHIDRNSIKIVDSGNRAMRIDRSGLVSLFDSLGHERQLFGLAPGGLPKFVNASDDEKKDPNTGHTKENSTKDPAVTNEATALLASVQGAVSPEDASSKQGQLAEIGATLSNAAHKATNEGDLSTANSNSQLLNGVLAAADRLARKSDTLTT